MMQDIIFKPLLPNVLFIILHCQQMMSMLNMLKELGAIDRQTHKVIHPMTRGRLYNGHYNGDLFQMAVESAVDQTIKFILDNPGLETKENDVDMFDYEDEMEHYCEECDEVADGVWGSLCSSCEEYQEQMEEDYA